MKKNRLFANSIVHIATGSIVHSMPTHHYLKFRYLYSSIIDFSDHKLMNDLFIHNINWNKQLNIKCNVKPFHGYRQYKSKGCRIRH